MIPRKNNPKELRVKINKTRPRRALCLLMMAVLAAMLSCEDRAYNRARDQGATSALEQFLKKYPNSRHRGEARGQLIFMAYQEAAGKNTVAAYEDYLQRFPDSRLRLLAVKALMNLLEPELKALTVEQMSSMKALVKTDYGTILIRLDPRKAPETCRNFIKLARAHFYDQSFFSMTVPGVLVQGGSPDGALAGGPGYFLKAEFNDLTNIPGAVGMARGSHPDTAGSQFYIGLVKLPQRDGKYTVFGQVEQGLDAARELSYQDSTGPQGAPTPFRPLKPLMIKTVEIIRVQ
jgi:peptidyl-prolyl cis-trans isomerase B (cyclophilin B)